MNFGLRGLLLLLAVVLFIVGALSDGGNKVDLLYWGLAVFAACVHRRQHPARQHDRARRPGPHLVPAD